MKGNLILKDYRTAVSRLKEALDTPAETDLIRAGCIQYFEFCFELAWKSIKLVSREHGLEACNSPKNCLKQAFAQGWIDDEETWLAMLSARNRLSHTYNADQALTIYQSLKTFLPPLRHLADTLQAEIE